MIYDAQGLKVELSAQDDPAPERRHTARVRLDNYGWNRPTLAGLLSAPISASEKRRIAWEIRRLRRLVAERTEMIRAFLRLKENLHG